MIKKNSPKVNILTDEIVLNSKLFPLFENSTKLLFQLFVLKTINNNTNDPTYQIIYGMCIRTTKEDISKDVFCSDFSRIYTALDTTYDIAKISIYNYPKIITQLVNYLLLGKSLKTAIFESGLKSDKLKFDLAYSSTQHNIIIRPIIFNDPNTIISMSQYEKNALISPYKALPSYTLTLYNLNKIEIVKCADNASVHFNQTILSILKYLEKETTMPFSGSGCTRFGNIEFINCQCSDKYEVPYVTYECIREEVEINSKKVTVTKKVSISITPNIHTCSKQVLINCTVKNGKQIILDECKQIYHSEKETLTVGFETQESISQIAISIWTGHNNTFQLWYKNSFGLIRQIGFNIGIVSFQGIVKSEWLNKIEESNSKVIEKIRDVEKTSRTSYISNTIGGYSSDPWVAVDSSFSKLTNQISPKKSDAEFFTQGWDSETNEHGGISFLEWFKKITNNTKKVVIQDPFYDDVGLEFIARTANTNTEFIILTCTQVSSYDDTRDDSETEPDRALRIKSIIKSNPSSFNSVKMNIYDLRSRGGGDKSILHDRYILIFEDDVLIKGFHLSNSIQGATKSHPLLITPIPQDVLCKIDTHINNLIYSSNNNIVSLYNFNDTKLPIICNEDQDTIENKKSIEEITKIITPNTTKSDIVKFISTELESKSFAEFWSIFGNFLANVNYPETILSSLESMVEFNFAPKLSSYLEGTVVDKYPLGFSEKAYHKDNDLGFLFVDNLENIVKRLLRIGGYIHEPYAYNNYGAYYGCELLLKLDLEEYLKLIEFIRNLHIKNKDKDLTNSPISKLSNIVMTTLLMTLFREKDIHIIKKLLNSHNDVIKAIAISALISVITQENNSIEFDESKEILLKNLTEDELLFTFITCLLNLRLKKLHTNSILEASIFTSIAEILLNNYSKERVNYLFENILHSSYPLIEKKITEQILFKLEEEKKITPNEIFKLWTDEFIKLTNNFDSFKEYSGIIDMIGWSFQIADKENRTGFVRKLETLLKKEFFEIQKPFKEKLGALGHAFEKILLVRTILIIAVLYDKDNIDDYSMIIELINNITNLETNHLYYKPDSNIIKLSDNILKKYQDSDVT